MAIKLVFKMKRKKRLTRICISQVNGMGQRGDSETCETWLSNFDRDHDTEESAQASPWVFFFIWLEIQLIYLFYSSWRNHKRTAHWLLCHGYQRYWNYEIAQESLRHNQIWTQVSFLRQVSMSIWLPNHSVYTVRRLWKEWNILSTRKQKHTTETIHAEVFNIRERHPLRGIEGIRKTLREEQGMRVPRWERISAWSHILTYCV